MKIKLEIKNRYTGSVIFSYEKEDNTIKETLKQAILSDANLYSADLSDANLYSADLSGANLSGANLSGANLSGANLYSANLSGANLYSANLYSADLSRANLSGANLSGANLSGANLSGANLSGANLSRANLYSANLYSANLSGANLSGANLYSADLSRANLSGAKNAEFTIAQTRICAEGNIVGYKKAQDLQGNDVIVELLIPAEAKRNNAFGRKCRAEFATVVEINKLSDGTACLEAVSNHDRLFKYSIGDTIRPTKSFDENFQEECSSGIHFFITRIEAEKY
jgi:hypothetical protein